MSLILTVLAESSHAELAIARELEALLHSQNHLKVVPASQGGELGSVVFVDGAMKGLDSALDGLDRKRRAVFLIVKDGAGVPSALEQGKVDDVLVHPFRLLEILSKVRSFSQILMWDEVSTLNESFAEMIQRLQEDFRLAERLQKGKLPVRFPEVKGFRISSRYLAGMKSGGDHFDLAESKDGSQLSIVLSDASSYGLSSAVLSVLMKVAMKLSSEEARSSLETVKRIQDELKLTLGEKDRLSLFYGVINRRDYKLKYLNLGSSCAFLAKARGGFQLLPHQGEAISKHKAMPSMKEGEVALNPEDRLVLLSDGFVDAAGGPEKASELLERFRDAEPADTLNELVFQVKSRFSEPDDLPEQDCTAGIFDVSNKLIRLA